jgi:hypothetical protein
VAQVKFTLTRETIAYLRWFARTILLETNEHDAAKHLMMKQLEATRRAHKNEEPAVDELLRLAGPIEKAEGDKG